MYPSANTINHRLKKKAKLRPPGIQTSFEGLFSNSDHGLTFGREDAFFEGQEEEEALSIAQEKEVSGV